MLVSIPIYHAMPVRSSVRFIGQTVVLHGWGWREQRCVVFESLRQVLVTWLYTSSVIVSLLLTQMIRVKPENGTRFVTLGGEGGGGGAAQIAGAAWMVLFWGTERGLFWKVPSFVQRWFIIQSPPKHFDFLFEILDWLSVRRQKNVTRQKHGASQ